MESIKDDDSIITTGFVEKDELRELHSNSYLYVLPSDVEGMPMSLLEALSYGNKLLTKETNGLSLPELADFMRYYGVYSGANFDGGGSTQLITKNPQTNEFEVTVRSSDYGTYVLENSRPVINTLLVYVKEK